MYRVYTFTFLILKRNIYRMFDKFLGDFSFYLVSLDYPNIYERGCTYKRPGSLIDQSWRYYGKPPAIFCKLRVNFSLGEVEDNLTATVGGRSFSRRRFYTARIKR